MVPPLHQKEADELIIEGGAEKFLVLFEKIFVEEAEETDSEDGPAGDIIGKIVSKIKDKIDSTIAKNSSKTNIGYSGNFHKK